MYTTSWIMSNFPPWKQWERLLSLNSEQCFFALTCNCQFSQRRESNAVTLIDASKVFTATETVEAKNMTLICPCLPGCAGKHECFKQDTLDPTH